MIQPITTYLTHIQQNLATGDATEHTHRSDLEALLESLAEDVQAINEPRRIDCGAPDLAVLRDGLLVGHVEAKDVGTVLDVAERSEQLRRYRDALDNLILTDYLEFRWYVGGELRQTVRVGTPDDHGRIRASREDKQALHDLLTDFLAHTPEPISTPRELAERMARMAHLIREIIVIAFETNRASETLKVWRQAFAEVLIAELDQPENVGQFADMFAQTLAYGLFSARVMSFSSPSPNVGEGAGGRGFTRQTAQGLIPRTNPFLRKFFYYITGPDLDDEPYAGLVNDLVQLLAHADMDAILADFGQRTRQDDPTVHFYETFLAAYDPALRERRGVYYTPTPVVSFIVRSVDALLKAKFGLPKGLADTSTLSPPSIPPQARGGSAFPSVSPQAGGSQTLPKVLILDPSTGTGTFLYSVIAHIRTQFMEGGNAGMWSGFVREHLLPRIFGFELLMAPYAVAHFKLAFQLAGHDLPEAQRDIWAYDFASDERIQVYLTNALEAIEEEVMGLWGPLRIVTEEAQAANKVKQDYPIMVIISNPPYSVSSANKSDYIEDLMVRYKHAVRSERNIQPLSDDYIKFIRLAHDRIERTGHGVLGFITNHSYLSGLIHRGMREALLKSFDELYILNLHGNALLGETAPDGGKDENVFDIRQGVAIALMVKTGEGMGLATVRYADLWGQRESKYRVLNENDVETLTWEPLDPVAPYYFFVPKDFSLREEYEQGWPVNAIIPAASNGIKTHRDHFVIDFDVQTLHQRIADLRTTLSDDVLRRRYGLNDTRDWQLSQARTALKEDDQWEQAFATCLYRPFDVRPIYYSDAVIEFARYDVMQHMLKDNLALLTVRRIRSDIYTHFGVSQTLVGKDAVSMLDSCVVLPLYLYPNGNPAMLLDGTETVPWDPDPEHGRRVPNLAPKFVAEMEEKLGLSFDAHKTTNAPGDIFGPRDILAYIYAVFHSPTYRERYAEFLKIDFPRVPLTSDRDLFWQLAGLGSELIALHLLDPQAPPLRNSAQAQRRGPGVGVTFPIPGDNRVKQRGGFPTFIPAGESRTKTSDVAERNRVYINLEQYFAGVPEEVWAFEVGGYQVLHKWLKDRKGRVLSYAELEHYQRMVVALQETLRVMGEVDGVIGEWPIA
jgi:hypothetical protein